MVRGSGLQERFRNQFFCDPEHRRCCRRRLASHSRNQKTSGETSNANRPDRCLCSRIGFLGLGEPSSRCRPARRCADSYYHGRVVWRRPRRSEPRIDKGRASPGLFLSRTWWSPRHGPGLSGRHHETLTAFAAMDRCTAGPTNFSARRVVLHCGAKGSTKWKIFF